LSIPWFSVHVRPCKREIGLNGKKAWLSYMKLHLMLFKVVATKIADGRCEKKKTCMYLQIIIQFQSMLF